MALEDYDPSDSVREYDDPTSLGRIVLKRRKIMAKFVPSSHNLPNMVNSVNIANNRFYVGSHKALLNKWGKKTMAAAVQHAKKLVDESGEDQFIVQIVAVVQKQKTPVIVKKV